ncbi:ATP-binding protein [Sulfitobacter sp. D35]|uniref:two-component system sensor histidine kinase NtrB n=1 Tax=Sulfitobacter sp. D35 TaxID=3083252 RepID=UPI00296E5C0D|nr:ATP-binding protein [Sulfitobacter sp. D35]MDW4500327.1 ATP-binding protein [Sulfitobacter sp. D35]
MKDRQTPPFDAVTEPDGPSEDSLLYSGIGGAARAHEIMLQQAARLAGLGYFVFDTQREIIEVCSERHAMIFDRTPLQFMADATGLKGEMNMMHPEDADSVRAAYDRLRMGRPVDLEYRFFRRDGSVGYVREFVAPETDASGQVIRGLGASIDVTEMRLAEQRRANAHRLEALGELTAGVAHDFNNLFAIILGNSELAREVPDEAELCHREIVQAVQRGKSLTRNLLNFAQKARVSPVMGDIRADISKAAEAFNRAAPDGVEVTVGVPSEALPTLLDRDQFQAVLANLFLNARDAVAPSGAIEVSGHRVAPDEIRRLATEHGLTGNAFCVVEVTDNGCGMTPGVLRRAAEPFFTTKSRAEGSGLGLSMATGFVNQAGGALEIVSRDGAGTTVRLFFPLAEDAADAHRA